MRARRADYTAPGQLNDIPYSSLDCEEYPPSAASRPFAPSPFACRSPFPDRNSSAFYKASSLSKGSNLADGNLYLERNHLLVPEESLASACSRPRNLEWNTCIGAAPNGISDGKLGGKSRTIGPADCFPLPVTRYLDQNLKAGDGGPSSLLQRQSSGSSTTDSLFSSDVPLSTLSPTFSLSASDSTLLGTFLDDISKQDGSIDARQQRSWAQQTEQSYNLQLALALRLVAEAGLSEEPLLLPCFTKEKRQVICSAGTSSVQATAFRFWVNGALTYADRVDDGFYHIWGMNPHVWAICNYSDKGDGRIPTLDLLKGVNPAENLMEVVVVNKHGDSRLCDMENQAFNLAFKAADSMELAERLGKLVSQNMGGTASTEEGDLISRWQAGSMALKDCLNSIVVPIGSISIGVCRHRALLYKALADSLNLPCRIARGCKYCGLADGFSCLVFCGTEREFLVDLICTPGNLSSPDSFLKSQSLPNITSPLRLPELNLSGCSELEMAESFRGAKRPGCELDWLTSSVIEQGHIVNNHAVWKSLALDPSVGRRTPELHESSEGPPQAMEKTKPQKSQIAHYQVSSAVINIDAMPQCSTLQAENQSGLASPVPASLADMDIVDERKRDFLEETGGALMKARNLEQSLALDGLDIAWDELNLKERIGAGSFGTVHRADWNGSDVAVKVFAEQDFFEERLNEFIREVAIMKRTRHPNVVLFMGAVTKHPNLSIVTEYLPRGSLFRLLHRPGMREMLDERRCIRMALDIAKGVNYLHRLSPPIVHRDLKSPNLLVDKTWTVKVCDFGLSRLKAKTFLSSRSAAGTAEWMAPEVLRDEPSNEKSDVYSFGVILWEIFTLQQPWSGLNAAQVVGAVGFQHRRLQIPKDFNLKIAALIESCWSTDPWQRPSFTTIMESLKQLLSNN